MPGEAAPGGKAVLKKFPQQMFVLGKSHHAVANIAGRKNAVFAAQAPGASAVIGDSDNGRQIGDGFRRAAASGLGHVSFQAAQDS